jgi:UDP-GlcNAc:undecaprenyl-phosphate/decaprenyl-phosphate GlcNAc-1-phosphate transferase
MFTVSISAAVLMCALLCSHASVVGKFLKVIDYPDNASKRHPIPTPAVGGVCILLPAVLAILVTIMDGPQSAEKLPIAVGLGAAGIGTIGLMDDQSSITPLGRMLSILIFLIAALVIDPGLTPAAFTWSSLPPLPTHPFVYWVISALASAGIVNAINMADGQNGLIPGVFVICAGCLSLIADPTIAPMAEILLAVSLVVFVYNLWGKLFLGSCGSYGVTFALCLLLAAQHARGGISVETVFTYFAFPMLDCIRLLITRLVQRRSPASRDNNHLHHHLQEAFGWRVSLIAYLGFTGAASIIATLYPRWALLCASASAAVYFGLIAVYVWKVPFFHWDSLVWITDPSQAARGSFVHRAGSFLSGSPEMALARSRSPSSSENSAMGVTEYLVNKDAA